MTIKMKELPILDRPRERLKSIGVENLSNEELLAILLKTGSKETSVKELAITILKELKDIKNLKYSTYETLTKIKGIGDAKACVLLAGVELGSRVSRKLEVVNGVKIKSSADIYEYYKERLKDKTQEYFYCIYLDNNHRIIKEKLLFIGTVNHSIIHPREIFKEAYLNSASSIICLHNHPSSNITPSKEDIRMTELLLEVGNLLGIKILDHLIIGKNNYYSILENIQIKGEEP